MTGLPERVGRREFVAGSAALLVSACGVMTQIRGSDRALSMPPPETWRPVLRALLTGILPFEHVRFPAIDVLALEAQLLSMFPIDQAPEFADVPVALMLFDDCALFGTPLAPFIADERRSLLANRVASSELPAAIERACDSDRRAFHAYLQRFGDAHFVDQTLEARRAYLVLWSGSELSARRRVYRGWKSLATISAYSTAAFWAAIGYDGPLLEHG
jgi:hypothetical protein